MATDFFKGLGSYIPPEIRRFSPAIKTVADILRPTQIVKNPAVSNLVRSPSLANLGTVLSNTAMTAAEVVPGGKFITTPIKKTSKLVDDLLKKGDLKKASELTQDPLNLMSIKRDRFGRIIESKKTKTTDEKIKDLLNKIGSKKAKKAEEILKDLDDETLMLTKPDDIINILNKGGLEGTISSNVAKNIKNLVKKKRGIDEKYFNINFLTEKGTQAKKIFDDVYGGVITKGEGAVKLQELYPSAKLGFINIGSKKMQKAGKQTVTARFGEVFEDYINKFKEGKQPVAVEGKVFKAGRFYSDLGPTYTTVIKDSTKRYEKDTPKFYKMYDELDDKNKVVVENFLESALPFFAKGESRGLPMAKMRELIARMYKSKSRKGISDEELFKQLNNVDMRALVNVLKQNQILVNKIKDANAQGINLSSFNLSHIADVANNWKNTLDANNLYFLETKLNLSDSKNANKQIKELLEEAKVAKTTKEKNKITEKINALGEILENKNLITKVEGQTFGAKNVDSKSSFERIKKNLEKEYFEKDPGIVDYANGGMVGISHLTRPLGNF
jgi:hypothetical protein